MELFDEKHLAIIPFVDMLNHKPFPHALTSVKFDEEAMTFKVHALEAYETGISSTLNHQSYAQLVHA